MTRASETKWAAKWADSYSSPGGGILREKMQRLTNPAVTYLELELVLTFFCGEVADSLAALDL